MRHNLNKDPTPDADNLPTLAEAVPGHSYVVAAVRGDDALAHHLRAAGLWPEVALQCIGRAPFRGPLLFKLHGFRLALRRDEAQRVQLLPEQAP